MNRRDAERITTEYSVQELQSYQGQLLLSVTGECGEEKILLIPDPKLWSPEKPVLYTCVVRAGEDEVREHFGIRTLTWTADRGIAINVSG